MQRDFLCGANEETRKICWVSWDMICNPKENGGLGIRNIEKFNLALLHKWRWRILHEREKLWVRILNSKYGCIDSNLRHVRGRPKGSTWWCDMLKLMQIEANDDWFNEGLRRTVGEGTSIRFWTDKWFGNEALKDRFGRLYSVASDKNISLAQMGVWVENRWNWNWSWRRGLFSWECELLRNLQNELGDFKPETGVKDGWKWLWDESGIYTVKSAYKCMSGLNNTEESAFFKKFWSAKAPLKIRIFAWRALMNKIPTKVNLVRRGVSINDGMNCSLCEKDPEASEHLFFKCPIVYKVWMKFYGWFGLSTVLPSNLKDHFVQDMYLSRSNNERAEWRCLWFFVLWTIWTCRNKAIFRNEAFDVDEILDLIKIRTWCWIRTIKENFSYSFWDWSNFPSHCLGL